MSKKNGAENLAKIFSEDIKKGGFRITNKKLIKLGNDRIKNVPKLGAEGVILCLKRYLPKNHLAYNNGKVTIFYNGNHLIKYFNSKLVI